MGKMMSLRNVSNVVGLLIGGITGAAVMMYFKGETFSLLQFVVTAVAGATIGYLLRAIVSADWSADHTEIQVWPGKAALLPHRELVCGLIAFVVKLGLLIAAAGFVAALSIFKVHEYVFLLGMSAATLFGVAVMLSDLTDWLDDRLFGRKVAT